MKNCILIFAVLLMFGCGGQALKQPRGGSLINSPVLAQIDSVIPQKPPVWPDSVTKLKYGKIIDKIRTKCDSYIEVDSLPDFVDQIHISPDGKYRFYSGDVDTVSQGYNYATYIEFKDLYGKDNGCRAKTKEYGPGGIAYSLKNAKFAGKIYWI